MADNTTLNTMTGGDVYRSKDRSGVKTSIIALDLNPSGSEQLQESVALGDGTSNPTLPSWGVFMQLFNGTTWDRVRGDTTNGLDVDVTRLPSLPAGSNAIGKLAANDGVDIGDVTINNPTLTVVNAGTFVVQDNQVLTDNAQFTDGSNKVFTAGYIYDEVAGTALTENDVAAARINANRAIVGIIEDGSTRARYATVTASNALKVDGSAVTQPVSIAATVTVDSELPAAAALADAAANPTAPLVGDCLLVYNGSTWDRAREAVDALDSTGTGILSAAMIAQFDNVSPTPITENQFGNVRMSANRSLFVNIRDAAGNERGVNVNASNQMSVSVDNTVAVGNVATIGTSIVPGTGATNLGKAEDAVAITGDTGVFILGVRRDTPASNCANGDYCEIPVSGQGAVWVSMTPSTGGGWSISRTLSTASTNATSIKASAGIVGGWYIFNTNTSRRYVKLYNKASSPTVGTDTPAITIPVPAGGAVNVEFTNGINFGAGIAMAMTTGVADSDTGAVGANDLILNLFYK
jgi:hypothetical protein